jgi:hypothetical protein
MAIIGNQHKTTRHQTIAYDDLVDGGNMAILADVTVITNGNTRGKGLLMITCPTTKNRMTLDDCVIAYDNMFLPPSPKPTRATDNGVMTKMSQIMTYPLRIQRIQIDT